MEKIIKENTFMENKDGNINNISNTNVHNNKEETKNEEKKYGFKVKSSRDVQDGVYNQKDFIIDGLITPGLNILAGPKKHGKSMLALNLALSIAGDKNFWGRETEHGRVLYMALEDTEKRIRDRMNEMLDYTDAPDFDFIYDVDKKGPGFNEDLEAYLQENPDTKAVIIDVLEKIRTSKPGSQSEYSHDYDELGALQKLANKHGVALITVTHCRKTRDYDWINEIAGGVGVTGAADTILMLKKEGQKNPDGKLFITGRDVPGNEIAVRLNEHLKWDYVGTSDELELEKALEIYNSSPISKTIRLLLEKNHGQWSGTSRELLDCGLKELGEPIAKNESALARKINKFDRLFQKDCIIHTRPDSNGGLAGRIHHFRVEKPIQQPQEELSKVISMGLEQGAQMLPEEEYELPW